MSKRIFYTDPRYTLKIKNIFGYRGMCHYNEISHDIKEILDNDMNVMCYRVKRNKNLYTLIIYWVLSRNVYCIFMERNNFINRLFNIIIY